MSTVLIATRPEELQVLLAWTPVLSAAPSKPLNVILVQRSRGRAQLQRLPEPAESDEPELVAQYREVLSRTPSQASDGPSVYVLQGDDWATHVNSELASLRAELVLVTAPELAREATAADDWRGGLLEQWDGELILIQDDAHNFDDDLRVAVVLNGEADSDCVLRRTVQAVSSVESAEAVAVYVEPDVGDLATSVGMRQLSDRLAASLNHYERAQLQRRVIVSGSLSQVVQQLEAENFDLILLGTARRRVMQRFWGALAGGGETETIPALAVVRGSRSLGTRLSARLGRWVQSVVPQLAREERVGLVSRIQTASQWDFDFVLLISLATVIACLGLAENSGAVIVGAMLVAPLMTPIAGVGLGVAHGNLFLTRVAFRTVVRGFATALLIGVLFGGVVQLAAAAGWLEPLRQGTDQLWSFPSEMENRTHPQFYDLLIALAGGVAAAYAMGRPNLYSALPGVAIAAALVPPIATSGIAFAHAEWLKGCGSLLLFLTNMVTIVLGTSVVFRLVGIRAQKQGQPAARWTRTVLAVLVLVSVLLTLLMNWV